MTHITKRQRKFAATIRVLQMQSETPEEVMIRLLREYFKHKED